MMNVHVLKSDGSTKVWQDVGGWANEPEGALVIWADGEGVSAKVTYAQGRWWEVWTE